MDPNLAYIEYIREISWKKLILTETQNQEGILLDVGCGPGDSWSLFKAHVIGVDITFDAQTISRAKQSGVDLILCDAHFLPVKEKSPP
jgi:ubiquinone/menaquinone biosynthesis C-methylase UbiE